MKTKHRNQINLTENGRSEWEMTDDYRDRSRKIVDEVTVKYSTQLSNERSWIKRLLIKVRMQVEISRRIDELSSSRNLHGMANSMLS